MLSPSTAAEDRADKMPFYAEAQVSHAWLVDPTARAEPLDAFPLDLGSL